MSSVGEGVVFNLLMGDISSSRDAGMMGCVETMFALSLLGRLSSRIPTTIFFERFKKGVVTREVYLNSYTCGLGFCWTFIHRIFVSPNG